MASDVKCPQPRDKLGRLEQSSQRLPKMIPHLVSRSPWPSLVLPEPCSALRTGRAWSTRKKEEGSRGVNQGWGAILRETGFTGIKKALKFPK